MSQLFQYSAKPQHTRVKNNQIKKAKRKDGDIFMWFPKHAPILYRSANQNQTRLRKPNHRFYYVFLFFLFCLVNHQLITWPLLSFTPTARPFWTTIFSTWLLREIRPPNFCIPRTRASTTAPLPWRGYSRLQPGLYHSANMYTWKYQRTTYYPTNKRSTSRVIFHEDTKIVTTH